MEFPLTPQVKEILCGRGMCKGDKLLCAARNCLHHPKESSSPDFGREIVPKGYAICPRCSVKTSWENGRVWSDKVQKNLMKCQACGRIIPYKLIIWTQIVFSKHRKKSHEHFHGECWDAMFIDIPDD